MDHWKFHQIPLQSATSVALHHILCDKLSIITHFSFYKSCIWVFLRIFKIHISRPFS